MMDFFTNYKILEGSYENILKKKVALSIIAAGVYNSKLERVIDVCDSATISYRLCELAGMLFLYCD